MWPQGDKLRGTVCLVGEEQDDKEVQSYAKGLKRSSMQIWQVILLSTLETTYISHDVSASGCYAVYRNALLLLSCALISVL